MASQSPGFPGEEDPLYRIGVMLINAYGYNWYRLDNQMRADDLIVRSRASDNLGGAAARLRDLESRYRRRFIPLPTREHPDPDPRISRRYDNFAIWSSASTKSTRGCAVSLCQRTTESGSDIATSWIRWRDSEIAMYC